MEGGRCRTGADQRHPPVFFFFFGLLLVWGVLARPFAGELGFAGLLRRARISTSLLFPTIFCLHARADLESLARQSAEKFMEENLAREKAEMKLAFQKVRACTRVLGRWVWRVGVFVPGCRPTTVRAMLLLPNPLSFCLPSRGRGLGAGGNVGAPRKLHQRPRRQRRPAGENGAHHVTNRALLFFPVDILLGSNVLKSSCPSFMRGSSAVCRCLVTCCA